ncbi:MAG: glycosyltransferase [Patescibacteria group bacterium]|nr:glycosyltransferase [Patescibacteria group bacterium]
MKVALVYDRVNKWGGAERVLLTLHELFPKAPLYTSLYNKKKTPWADVFEVRTSFLQKLPAASSNHEKLSILMPFAFESFSFDEFDLVISLTSEAAKGIITSPKSLHICYCLTPTRYLWSGHNDYFKKKLFRALSKPAVSHLRRWDKKAAKRPNHFISISKEVQNRIKKYYGRDSVVIYPPVTLDSSDAGPAAYSSQGAPASLASAANADALLGSPPLASPASGSKRKSLTKRYTLNANDYFLVVSRLVPYKKIDIAIKAFNKLGLPLKVVGTGSDEKRLKKMAKRNISFVGSLTDEELVGYYKGCLALIFPGKEDFGLTILEAQKYLKPVIAFSDGGALESIIEGKTGLFFREQNEHSLAHILSNFDKLKFKESDFKKQAARFGKDRFRKEFMKFLDEKIKEHF